MSITWSVLAEEGLQGHDGLTRYFRRCAPGPALRTGLVLGLAAILLASLPEAVGPGDRRIGSSGCSLRRRRSRKRFIDLHDELLVIIFAISAFVLALLLYVIVRFRASRNPVPTRTSHNTVIEILWTVVPVLILVIIAIPSFRLMYFMDRVPNADMTIKVDRKPVVLDLRLPRPGRSLVRQQHHPGEGPEAGPETAARCRQPSRRPGRHQHPGADHRHRRHPQLVRSVLRHPVLRNPRPRQRDLDAGRVSGHLLRRMQPDLRHQPRLHADQGGGGLETRVRAMARRGQEEIRLDAPPAGDARGRIARSRPRSPPPIRPRTDSEEAHDELTTTLTPPTTPSTPIIGRALSRAGCSRPTTRTSARST